MQIIGKEESYKWLSLRNASKSANREKCNGRFKPSVSTVRAVRKCNSGKYQSRTEDDPRSEDIDVPDEVRMRYASLDVGNETSCERNHRGELEVSNAGKNRTLDGPGMPTSSPKDINMSKSCSNDDLGLLYTDAAHMVLD